MKGSQFTISPYSDVAPNEFRAPDEFEAVYREGGKFDGAPIDLGKGTFWEEASDVPLIFFWKGRLVKGVQKKTLFSSVDLVPPLLGALGTDPPDDMDGADLSGDVMSDEPGTDVGYVYMRLYKWAAVRHKQYVYAFDRRVNRSCYNLIFSGVHADVVPSKAGHDWLDGQHIHFVLTKRFKKYGAMQDWALKLKRK